MDDNNSNLRNKALIAIVAVALIGIAAGATAWQGANRDSAATPSPQASVSSATPSTTAIKSAYRDGAYTATGRYATPQNTESLGVSITLAGDTVKDVSAQSLAELPQSKEFQAQFLSGYKAQVVGKKLDELMLDKVSGSSLTPKGFNDAVQQIKAQAKA